MHIDTILEIEVSYHHNQKITIFVVSLANLDIQYIYSNAFNDHTPTNTSSFIRTPSIP